MHSYTKALKFILMLCLIMNINTKCKAGQYRRLKGCLDCPTGTYSTDGDNYDCIYCSPGTYASQKGSKFCMPCKAGTFAEYEGSSSCEQCPDGTWSNSGSSYCDKSIKEGEGSDYLYYSYFLYSTWDFIIENYNKLIEKEKSKKKYDFKDNYYKPGAANEINYG